MGFSLIVNQATLPNQDQFRSWNQPVLCKVACSRKQREPL